MWGMIGQPQNCFIFHLLSAIFTTYENQALVKYTGWYLYDGLVEKRKQGTGLQYLIGMPSKHSCYIQDFVCCLLEKGLRNLPFFSFHLEFKKIRVSIQLFLYQSTLKNDYCSHLKILNKGQCQVTTELVRPFETFVEKLTVQCGRRGYLECTTLICVCTKR